MNFLLMEYTKTYNDLKAIFSPEENEIVIPGSEVTIRNVGFVSDSPTGSFININDRFIPENISFKYPVFVPSDKNSKKAILLLHGLNERSWLKYLPWAYYLASTTGSYVILFPISFHINRSPEEWKDPRVMIPFMKDRNSVLGQTGMSSFANIALSNRLTEDPLRFFRSGYQTTTDITKLLNSIRHNEHPVVPGGSHINIFAYSIGAFLSQILMMANPENLLEDSKLFMFCGGSVFSNMQGTSKLIMDKRAFDNVYRFYLDEFEDTLSVKSPLADFLKTTQIGMSFRAMIDLGRLKTFREKIFRTLRDQFHSISLKQDIVIPSEGIVATLKSNSKMGNVEVWDFPYPYIHENPFPVFNSELSKNVDYWFERVFTQAAVFLK
jgi:hypothetical protein